MRKVLFLVPLFLLASGCAKSPPPATPTPAPASTLTGSGPTGTPSAIPCLILNKPSSAGSALASLVEGKGHSLGSVNAAVTIVIYSDYQCPACAYVAQVLKQIYQIHPDDVRLITMDYPAPGHTLDPLAIQAVDAAYLQGKYWEMHDLLFEKEAAWSGLTPGAFTNWVAGQAAGLGLNADLFRSDFQSPEVTTAVASPPSFTPQSLPLVFINSDTPYNGQIDFAGVDQVVSLLALTKKQHTSCPPMVIDPTRQYLASLQTPKGTIVIQLLADRAPLAVNNFVFLARSGWYDNNTFQRVVPGMLVQTGDPSGTGLGNPGYFFQTELPQGLLFDHPGLVAMVNTGTDTNGSQFLITLSPQPQLNGAYTIFGQVLSGMDILGQLSPRDPTPGQYLPPGDALTSVTVTER